MEFLLNHISIDNTREKVKHTSIKGEKYSFKPSKYISLRSSGITQLDIPKGPERVYCNSNFIKQLKVPKSVKVLDCSDNKLNRLELRKGIEKVDCSNNQLIELKIPAGTKSVECHGNHITELKIPSSLEELHCDENVRIVPAGLWKEINPSLEIINPDDLNGGEGVLWN